MFNPLLFPHHHNSSSFLRFCILDFAYITITTAATTKQYSATVPEFRVAKLLPGILKALLTPCTADDAVLEAPCAADDAVFDTEPAAELATLPAPCVAVDAAPETAPAAVFAAPLIADPTAAAPARAL